MDRGHQYSFMAAALKVGEAQLANPITSLVGNKSWFGQTGHDVALRLARREESGPHHKRGIGCSRVRVLPAMNSTPPQLALFGGSFLFTQEERIYEIPQWCG